MRRTVKVSLGLATKAKQRRLAALRREILACTQRYIDHIWTNKGRLDSATLNCVSGGSLSYRHRANCLKIALETVISTRKAARARKIPASCPQVKGTIKLSSLVAKIEKGKGTFDYVLKVSGLSKGNPVVIPFKSHARLNYWLSKPGAKLLQGCILGDGWAALYISVPDQEEPKADGTVLGVDIGVNKLLVDSDGKEYGTEIKNVCARVCRCKPGSNGKLRAIRARTNYINRALKQLPWSTLGTLGVERLKNLKLGKKPNRSKTFRRAIAPWTYRQVITRIEQLSQENRVRLVFVDPRDTSRTCPNCKTVAKESRVGERFRCVDCGFTADADHVGAMNVLVRTYAASHQSMVGECSVA